MPEVIDFNQSLRSEIEGLLLDHIWDYEYSNPQDYKKGKREIRILRRYAEEWPELVRTLINEHLGKLTEIMPMPEFWFINQVGLMV